MTKTVDIKTPEGDTIYIEVEELGTVGRMRMAAKAPDSMLQEDTGEIRAKPEVVEYLVTLVEEQTVLTEELMEELSGEETSRLLEAVVAYSFGEEADLSRDDEQDDEIVFDSYDTDFRMN